ncbi:hypothetical protein B0T14DRAFT_599849 [Immersiella caudata]|uniref:Ubiquitin-like domain-containing protein n=1 Tax=Immersiella caudata TaxID=314043 RepID=A0AA40C607_9PEZI|nr:hypothetical protein B0T14DRAFT_599849 [Immersiella caudata]
MSDENAQTSDAQSSQATVPLTANLQIVSPNVGVGPLVFSALPHNTTVRQLKDRIRDTLPSRPTDDQQRLIHRGRLLARDTDTLKDVFTEDLLRNAEQLTLHLVLRDAVDHHPPAPAPSTTTPLRGQSPAPGDPSAAQHTHHHFARAHLGPQPTPGYPGTASPTPSHARQQAQAHLQHQALLRQHAAMQQMHHQQQQHQQHQQHQSMLQWMNQLQREGAYRQLLTPQQRDGATAAHGPQDPTSGQANVPEHTGGRNSPAYPMPTHTVVREGVGPNGQYWRMTVNETVTTASAIPGAPQHGGPATSPGPAPLSSADVANIMRGADATQATQTMTNAMHRSASGASLANVASLANFNGPIQPIQPGVTTPLFPGTPRYASRTATPDPAGRQGAHSGHPSVNVPHHAQLQTSTPNAQASAQPEVYILSSPTGPRGLLIHNGSEMYVTPPGTRPPNPLQFNTLPQALRPQLPLYPPAWSSGVQLPQQQPHQRQAQGDGAGLAQGQNQAAAARVGLRGAAGQQQIVQQVPVRPLHPNNPGAGAFVAAAWPHVWLLIRLVVFVWWFTSNDPSWSRWLTMVSIAIFVFVLNTGMLNALANQAWDPFRQHLEGLIPLAAPNQQPQPQPQRPGQPGAAPTEPNPAQTAARLVAERRRANGHWLLDQVRRVERASLLFLASIAPGVAERHIAHLEAQERAERQRREAEEAAATAAAAAAAAAAATDTENGTEGEQAADETAPTGPPAALDEPNLIEI